jgi:L,D-transpeptidase ErfK/SrfK
MSKIVASICLIGVFLFPSACQNPKESEGKTMQTLAEGNWSGPGKKSVLIRKPNQITVHADVPLKSYFAFMDSLIASCDSIGGMALTEHHLVMANPWILDTLRTTDYYYRLENRKEYIEDANNLIIIKKGIKLTIPDSAQLANLNEKINRTYIDVNIPEYKLRIWREDSLLYTMDVRVGKNEKKFLKMAGREVSLQTPIGKGEIVRINKAPWFINPVDNKRYYKTRRDDGQYTSLPLIPWLEPSINGQRPGSMIHPTTNKSTLGKAASNGCVGLAEGDMWVVYYHAPLGTMVEFKYELNVKSERGDTLKLEDIYKLNE